MGRSGLALLLLGAALALSFVPPAAGARGERLVLPGASQLGSWLTVDYHPVPMSKKQVRRRRHTTERFVPLKPKTAAAIRGGAHGSE